MVKTKTITIHPSKITVHEIANLNKLIDYNFPRLFNIDNMIDVNTFINEFGDESLFYSYNGNSTLMYGKITINQLLNNDNSKYIFSDIIESSLYEKIKRYFPRFESSNLKYIISRIYCGMTGTGSHFHYHPSALNYLISGKKLWLMLPPTLKNTDYYHKHVEYCTTEVSPLEWVDTKLPHIIKNTENLYMFTQEPETCVFVPSGWFHFVANLTNVVGITYSWTLISKN